MHANFISVLGYLVGVAGAITIIFSRVKTENLNDLKDRVEILEKELLYSRQQLEKEQQEARKQHIVNQKAIAKLEGQVEIYKDLQLDSIASTNRKILDVLESSALIAKDTAGDGGLLVKTKEENPLDVKQVK